MACILCGSTSTNICICGKDFQIAKCPKCGIMFTNNFFEKPNHYKDNDYFIAINNYLKQWNDFALCFERLMDRITKFKKTGTFLDVGSSVGILLSVAQKRGFTVKGVEVSEWASEFARNEKGLDVVTGKLEDAHFANNSFDVVVLNHVLEHIEFPHTTLKEIFRILKNDGLVVINVPNAGSLLAKIKGTKWTPLYPEDHRWHFTPNTLKQLFKTTGFIPVFFEAKGNQGANGFNFKALIHRFINKIDTLTNNSELMELYGIKPKIVSSQRCDNLYREAS